jgi:hypothetical protein
MWLVADIQNGEAIYIKTRYKGINPKSLLLDTTEPFIKKTNKYYTINENGEKIKVKKQEEATITDSEYSVDYYDDNNETDKNIFEWAYSNGANKEIGSDYEINDGKILNQIKFFEKVYYNGYAYVLCNNLRRVVKNTNRNVSFQEQDKYNYYNNTVQLVYVVKKISA